MARYIDSDRSLKNLPDDLPYKASVRRVLMQAPEADVAEVVRCKDCKRFLEYADGKKRIEGADGDCSIRMMNTSDEQFWGVTFNDYCSYGKRKEGAKQ